MKKLQQGKTILTTSLSHPRRFFSPHKVLTQKNNQFKITSDTLGKQFSKNIINFNKEKNNSEKNPNNNSSRSIEPKERNIRVDYKKFFKGTNPDSYLPAVDYKKVKELLKITNAASYAIFISAVSTYPEYTIYVPIAAFASIFGQPLTEKLLLQIADEFYDKYLKENGDKTKTINPYLFTSMVVALACMTLKAFNDFNLKKQHDSMLRDYDKMLKNYKEHLDKCYDSNEEYIKFSKITDNHLEELLRLENNFQKKANSNQLTTCDINLYKSKRDKIIKKLKDNMSRLDLENNNSIENSKVLKSSTDNIHEFVKDNNLLDDPKYKEMFSEKKQTITRKRYEKS